MSYRKGPAPKLDESLKPFLDRELTKVEQEFRALLRRIEKLESP